MSFFSRLFATNAGKPYWPDLIGMGFRAKTAGELKDKFRELGANKNSIVAIRPNDAPSKDGLKRVKLSELPDNAIYHGLAPDMKRSSGTIPTFTISNK